MRQFALPNSVVSSVLHYLIEEEEPRTLRRIASNLSEDEALVEKAMETLLTLRLVEPRSVVNSESGSHTTFVVAEGVEATPLTITVAKRPEFWGS